MSSSSEEGPASAVGEGQEADKKTEDTDIQRKDVHSPLSSDRYAEQGVYIENNLEVLIRIHTAIKRSGLKLRNQRADDALKQAEQKYREEYDREKHEALTGQYGKHERFRRYLTKLVLWNSYTENLMQGLSYRICQLAEQERRLDVRESRDLDDSQGPEGSQDVGKSEGGQARESHEVLLQKKLLVVFRAYFCDPARLTIVQRRLIDANVVRRNRLDHAGRSRKTPSCAPEGQSQPAPQTKPPTQSMVQRSSLAAGNVAPSLRASRPTTRSKQGAQATKSFVTQPATALESKFSIMGALAPAPRSTARSAGTKMSARVGHLDYPSCPTKEDRPFPCPYCPMILPQDYKVKEKWRGHVAQDLCGYVCVFEDCESPEDMFVSTYEWMSHMARSHSEIEWVCPLCVKGRLPDVADDAQAASFPYPSQLKDHIVDCHLNMDSAADVSELELVVSAGRRTVGIRRVRCPLCRPGLVTSNEDVGGSAAPPLSADQAAGLVQLEEDQHVATHIHEFALHAFPSADGEEPPEGARVSVPSEPSTRVDIMFKGPRIPEGSLQGQEFAYTLENIQGVMENLKATFLQILGSAWIQAGTSERLNTMAARLDNLIPTHQLSQGEVDLDGFAWGLNESLDLVYQLGDTLPNSDKEDHIIKILKELDESLLRLPSLLEAGRRRQEQEPGKLGFEIVPRLSAPPSFPLYLVPVARNREFFGRRNELAAIEKFFFDEDENRDSPGNSLARTFAICGPGGMGKTQVAGEFVYTRKDRFDVIFWVHADSSAKLYDEFSRLAVELGLVARDSTDARDPIIIRDLVKGWLADPVKDGGATAAFWLLVFDNVDDMEVLEGFWPLDGPGCVLFTSRDPLAMESTYLADTGIDLQPFSARESSSFLEKLTLKKGDSSAIHARLGGLPLAMTQMASVIIHRDLSYSEFVQSYDELTRREELFQSQYSKPGREDYEKSIWTVWALESLKHGRSLLEVLSMLDPNGILEGLLTNEAAKPVQLKTFPKTPTEYQKARTELLQSSLISKDNSSKRIVIHRLIQDTARSKMTTAQFNETFDASLHLVSSMWPYEKFGWRHGVARWARCEELFPHVVTLRRLADQTHILDGHGGDVKKRLKLPKLLIDAGWYYRETGQSTESEPYFDFSATICQSILAQLKTNTPTQNGVTNGVIEADLKSMMAEVHHNLGCIGTETNRPEFTLHHFQLYNNMMIRESGSQTRGRDSRLHISWNELGNAFMMNRRWADGERCFKTSIESAKLQPDYKPTDASLPHVNLGLAYWLMGRHDAAMAQLKAGLSHREQAFGVDDSQSFITGRFLHAIGNVKASLGLHRESFVFHSRALAQYQKTIGKNHHRTGDVHVKMAEHFIRDKKFPAASEHICEALRIFGDRPAYRHEMMRTLFKAAAIYSGQGKETEAAQARDQCAALYGELYSGSGKAAADLTDADMDDAVAFWSR
ncbi:hypothetical protein RB597_003991 [Gaeumannomyces tritici]